MLREAIVKYKIGDVVSFLSSYRYVIVLIAFAVWMAFFDRINVMNHYSLYRAKTRLIKEQDYFRSQIEESKNLNEEIHNNLEKFAREKYFMHKPDEDVFVFK